MLAAAGGRGAADDELDDRRAAGRADGAVAAGVRRLRGSASSSPSWTRSCSVCGRARTGRARRGSAATTRSGMGEGARAMAELAELDALAEQLAQSYPGARLEDIDLEALERQLGERGPVDARRLAELERELREQGPVRAGARRLAAACRRRRCAGSASPRCATYSTARGASGERDTGRAGAAGEPTGATRPWAFGDTEPWDVPRTLRNAVLRTAGGGSDRSS